MIYKSDIAVHIPQDQNLTELLHTSARPGVVPPAHIIFEDELEGRKLTKQNLIKSAGCLAYALNTYYHPLDQSRWAIMLPNCISIIETVHAVLWLGGVICPINHQLMPQEISHAFSISRPNYIIVYKPVIEKVEAALNLLAEQSSEFQKPHIITALGNGSLGPYPSLQHDFISSESMPTPHYENTQERLAAVYLSSGTTGLPKGVALSQFNLISNVYQLWAHDPDRWSSNDSFLALTPFVHMANGIIPYYLGPWTGMRHIIMSTYTLESLGKLIERTRPTTVQMLPTIVKDVIRSDITKRFDFSSVRRILGIHSGLEKHEVDKWFGPNKWKIQQAFGITEASCVVAMQKSSDTLPMGQSGTILPGLEVRLVKETGKDAPIGESGELWLRGPNITRGYFHNPEANKGAFPEPGWLNTGDVCHLSPDLVLSCIGRTKELIKYNGFQVSPTELEAYLFIDPDVLDCGVAPTVDEALGTELPTGYVVLKLQRSDKDSKIAALNNIHHRIDEKVSGYKRLRGGVWEVSRIPRNATSKPLRKEFHNYVTGVRSNKSYQRSSTKL